MLAEAAAAAAEARTRSKPVLERVTEGANDVFVGITECNLLSVCLCCAVRDSIFWSSAAHAPPPLLPPELSHFLASSLPLVAKPLLEFSEASLDHRCDLSVVVRLGPEEGGRDPCVVLGSNFRSVWFPCLLIRQPESMRGDTVQFFAYSSHVDLSLSFRHSRSRAASALRARMEAPQFWRSLRVELTSPASRRTAPWREARVETNVHSHLAWSWPCSC